MLIIVTSLLLYQRALDRPSWQRFALAGTAIGFAGSFKQTGIYVVLAVLLCWLIIRRAHRGHLGLLGAAMAVIGTYAVVMVSVFDVPGHDWYIGQSTTQVRRVLALQHSGGTLTSAGGVLHLLAAQYKFLIPSILLALTAFLSSHGGSCSATGHAIGSRQGQCALVQLASDRDRRFGFSSLKFPHTSPSSLYRHTASCGPRWPAGSGAQSGRAR